MGFGMGLLVSILSSIGPAKEASKISPKEALSFGTLETKAKMGIFDDIIRLVERILIKSALEKVDYVQVAAAQLLGINRNTLRKKMKELKIKVRSD
jgi:DNA-binding protein Fis